MNKVNINIFHNVGSNLAVFSENGNDIFKQIDKALQDNMVVHLDFSNIKILTAAFLNAAIGQLYSKYKSEKLKQTIRIFNISDSDKLLLKKVTDRAKEYFTTKNAISISKNITENE